MKRRLAMAAGGSILLVAVLAGCSVPVGGIVGLQREEDGSISAVVLMCEGHVDGVTIYSDTEAGTRRLGRWEFESPVTESGTLSLGASIESQLTDSVEYKTYAWSEDNTTSARGPTVSIATLATLSAGQIRAQDHDADGYAMATFSHEEFASMVDRYCETYRSS